MYRVRRRRDQIWVVFTITEMIRRVCVQISDSSVESTKTRGHLRAACWAHHWSHFIGWIHSVVPSLTFWMELFGRTNNKLRWWLSTTRILCPLTNPQLKNNSGENPTSNCQIGGFCWNCFVSTLIDRYRETDNGWITEAHYMFRLYFQIILSSQLDFFVKPK